MKAKRNLKKINVVNPTSSKPSIEYTTEELIELGKKLNVLKLARPLYDEADKKQNNKEQED